VLSSFLVLAAVASTASGQVFKRLHYHGFRLLVPAGWPVYDLTADPDVCARFNRHAVYLGAPGAGERCPAQAIGRTEAILIQVAPGRGRAAGEGGSSARASRRGSDPGAAVPALIGTGADSSGWLVDHRDGVLITATWANHPGLIRHALGLASLRELKHPAGDLPPGISNGAPPRTAAADRRRSASSPGAVFTGQGFDTCATPSPSTMSAWSSAYQAVGVYIGGVNEASCAGRGLTAGWVSRESAAGWHLFPIYVGRQAPSNLCGCQGIAAPYAGREGRFAAKDAVKQAVALGLGQGNPLYYDMEGYPRSRTNSAAVLRFLAAWTTQLHAEGYLSGVYSSGDSGIVDLVSAVGTGYAEPDDLWVARWNGVDSTADPSVPSGYWPSHERLHQDSGDVNETHGGVTLNVDDDYLDGATAAAGTAPGVAAAPAAQFPPTISGTPVQGQTLTLWHANWSGVPSSYTDQWEDCDSSGASCVPIAGATGQRYVLAASDVGQRLRVVETAANSYRTGNPVTSDPTRQVLNPVPLYWIRNRLGNVYPSVGTPFYGSPRAAGFRGSNITGAAGTLDTRGYWLVTATGKVFQFGDAAALPPVPHGHRIKGIVAAAGGGYWLYTAQGNVYPSAGTRWYGSPAGSGRRGPSITGVAATADGAGYWAVNSRGTVFAFGDAANLPPIPHTHRIIGIVAAPGGGYWLYTARGNVYPSLGARWYGSPSASHLPGRLTGLAASPDGQGYWTVSSQGVVSSFGDAPTVPPVAHAHRITGIFR
jgi:hypothetical protein